jgi:hypothetical protein
MHYYAKRDSRHRRVLELALYDVWIGEKRNLRALYALLQKQGYGVRGYNHRLEQALNFVNKATAAIAELEKTSSEASAT